MFHNTTVSVNEKLNARHTIKNTNSISNLYVISLILTALFKMKYQLFNYEASEK